MNTADPSSDQIEDTPNPPESDPTPTPNGASSNLASNAELVRKAEKRASWVRRLPLMPALIFTIIVTQLPFVITLWYSFNQWRFLSPGSFAWVGFDNYRNLWDNTFFREAAWNTALITFLTVFFASLLGIGIAVLLDRKFFGRGVARTLIITPFLIMPVAASLIWSNGMLNVTYGIFNYLLDIVGAEAIPFASRYPLWSVILVLVWQWTPFLTLIFLAGLQSQNPSVLEAARVDGASPRSIFFQLTMPHLRRYIELGALLGSIYLIQTFDTVDQLVGGAKGARNIPYFVYQRSIGGGWSFGEASAYGVMVVIASILLANVALRVLSGLLEGEDIT